MKKNNLINKNSMAGTVILAALIVFTCCLNIFVEAARVLDRTDVAAAATGETITTELPPASNIEDPTNSATTSDSGEDEICFRCYESVKMAQSSIAIQLDLVNKQNKLIKQQNKAAAAAAAAAMAASSTTTTTQPPSYTTTTTPLTSVRKPPKQQRNQRGSENSTTTTTTPNTRIRSLENHEPIVVSRLRVARSTDNQHQRSSGQLELGSRGLKRNQHPKSVKEPALKQLKHKQEQQLNETCKSLYEAQQCLNGISRECLGDLQFHSQEVYMKQWLGKLNCAPINDPTLRPYKWITRTIPRVQEPEKVPIPRPISSQEEIQKRLDAMFGGRSRSPIGVMLKPTLTSSASQKFNSLLESVQQQQTLQGGPSADSYSVKGRHLLSANEVMASNFYGHHDQSQPEGQLLAMTSQLLLVPAFLILIVLFVTLTSRYIKQIR